MIQVVLFDSAYGAVSGLSLTERGMDRKSVQQHLGLEIAHIVQTLV